MFQIMLQTSIGKDTSRDTKVQTVIMRTLYFWVWVTQDKHQIRNICQSCQSIEWMERQVVNLESIVLGHCTPFPYHNEASGFDTDFVFTNEANETLLDSLLRIWFVLACFQNSVTWQGERILNIISGGSRIFQMGGRCFVTNGGAHILFSGKKCMKLKEIGLKWGGARLLAPCYSKITIFLWIILNSIMKTSYFTYFENNLLKRPPGSLGAMVLLQNCSFDT